MRYGKLIDGNLEYAPSMLKDEGIWYVPPTVEILKKNGYKVVEETTPPEAKEHYSYTFVWKEKRNKIVQEWTETYNEPQYTVDERLSAIEDVLLEMMTE